MGRDLGVQIGQIQQGAKNCITDINGVMNT
jgi:L-aminopeptidase/D-esterase-like protein